jgi:hypothetical protein
MFYLSIESNSRFPLIGKDFLRQYRQLFRVAWDTAVASARSRSATPQDHAAKMNQTFVPKPLNEMHL